MSSLLANFFRQNVTLNMGAADESRPQTMYVKEVPFEQGAWNLPDPMRPEPYVPMGNDRIQWEQAARYPQELLKDRKKYRYPMGYRGTYYPDSDFSPYGTVKSSRYQTVTFTIDTSRLDAELARMREQIIRMLETEGMDSRPEMNARNAKIDTSAIDWDAMNKGLDKMLASMKKDQEEVKDV